MNHERIQQLQTIDFWDDGLGESKPTCMHDDCMKFAAFGGYCHFHSNASSDPWKLACCAGRISPLVDSAGEAHVEKGKRDR